MGIISKFNKAFENRIRLGVMSILMVNDWVEFNRFKELIDDVTDGNLASHLKALEKLEYIVVRKAFIGRKPQTSYAATEAGRQAFNDHLDALEAILRKRD
ncbi:MAG: transcriptional regulator [Bacteroidota bacterium]